jgi:hypothetical protein
LKKRVIAAEILITISEEQPATLVPIYVNWLPALYSEPVKEVENRLIAVMLKLSSLPEINMKKLYDFQSFFQKLYQKRSICSKVSLSRIHENNIKIFVNNLELQETLLEAYLSNILNKSDAANEFASFLKDFNAILVGYSLIRFFQEEEWHQILQSESFQKSFKEAYLHSVEQILEYFTQGNIQKLSQIFSPKIGLSLSQKIIGEIIKFKIDEALSNISVLPLDVLCSFFQDDNNVIVKTVYDLINNKEINAQITFIGDKTYISAMDLKIVDLRN